MVLLIKLGADSKEIDEALGVGPGNLRAQFSFGKIKKVKQSES